MAIAAPSDEVTRLVEALGLRTKNTFEVTLRMAVNEVVAVNTVEYVNGEQINALAAELKERQYRLARWIPVEERLPEGDFDVLVASPCPNSTTPNIDIASLSYEGELAVWREADCSTVRPTHWMPLPEPPISGSIEERIRDHVCDTLGVPRGQVAEPVGEEVIGLVPLPEPPEVN